MTDGLWRHQRRRTAADEDRGEAPTPDRRQQRFQVVDQRRDVLGVLKGVGAALDLPYLRRQADLYRLREVLEACLRDAGLNAGG